MPSRRSALRFVTVVVLLTARGAVPVATVEIDQLAAGAYVAGDIELLAGRASTNSHTA